jgi:3',5'-cyclic AMP phosphodiesterase CpdA
MRLFVKLALNRNFLIALLISAGFLISGCRSLSATTAIPTVSAASSDYFTIAVLPDTQYYSEKYPAIFTQQTQWIAEWAKAQHIVFVSQVGDLVEDYNVADEWKNAQSAMAVIRNAGIPYSVVPGNHDLNFEAGDSSEFDRYFPYTDFTAYPWYGSGQYPPGKNVPAADFPSGSNASNYETISAMGQNILILNLACTPQVLVNSNLYIWANSVLKYYSKYKAIIVTHGYINTAGDYTDSSSVSGVEIWNNVVNPNSNVVAVICGHIHGAFDASVVAEHGNTVENLLFDSQSDPNGGDGWIRLYRFYPQQNIVSATTYSPYLEEFDNSSTGAFTFSLKMTDPTTR